MRLPPFWQKLTDELKLPKSHQKTIGLSMYFKKNDWVRRFSGTRLTMSSVYRHRKDSGPAVTPGARPPARSAGIRRGRQNGSRNTFLTLLIDIIADFKLTAGHSQIEKELET
jgi:hypothetical protein